MAKSVNIDTPSPSLDKDLQDQIAMQNARETKQILMKQGANILVFSQDEIVRSTASTSYVLQDNLRQAFYSNGGLLEIDFKTVAFVNLLAMFVQLKIDGQEVDETVFESAVGATGSIYLKYRANLNAGNHIMDVGIRVNGGTGYLGRDSSSVTVPTTTWITETLI